MTGPRPKAPTKKTKPPEAKSHTDSNLPSHYQREDLKSSASDYELTETFVSSLPDADSIPGRGLSGLVRDHRDYIDEPVDESTGEPLLDFRWGSDTIPGRRERNIGKGYVPCPVKGRKPVPPGTAGAKNVTVAGATLLVRRADVAKLKRTQLNDQARYMARKSQENLNEQLSQGVREGLIEVTDSEKKREFVSADKE